ncbi:MAG: formylglycine-generating enzyme family protein, partial [Bacteroidota bacterium]|nr:formylglycine-generating enzyme family protein [Bacteroidota bacterium]
SIFGTSITFEMVPIPEGSFSMGSQNSEVGRKDDEGPVSTIKVDAFWMGKHEVTWDEYELFVYSTLEKEPIVQQAPKVKQIPGIDAISGPTPPYVDMSFGMGKSGYPAINMTQYAALSYCKWLTSKTGVFYRLPTEAEWEYACRAGVNTAYSFGEDPALLGEHAWYYDNSNGAYQKIGLKKPNPWGLYDMHGNVAEWSLDQYLPDYYSLKGRPSENPWASPTTLYPRVVRGGSWDDDAEDLRSAARRGSLPKWKQRDPQIPKSNWWQTDAPFLGFRIIRPVKQPSQEEIKQYFATPIKDL